MAAVRTVDSLKVKDLARRIGLTPSATGHHVKLLIADGALIATGRTNSRRLSLPSNGNVPKEVP